MWGWIAKLRQYVNRLTNILLGRSTLHKIVDANIASHQADVLALNQQLFDDALTVAEWEAAMRQHIKDSILQQYMLGRGGQAQMTFVDYGSVGGVYSDQLRFLRSFTQQIADGKLSLGQINQRSIMYINSSREAYNRAMARAFGIPFDKIPRWPADGKEGTCEGFTNCHCNWRFVEKYTLWECYWELGQVKETHCSLCPEHARRWNPLIIKKAE